MLYKKYHRNYVSQFKRGVKVKSIYSNYNFIISEVEIIIDYDWEINIIIKDGKKKWSAVIFPNGTTNYTIKVE